MRRISLLLLLTFVAVSVSTSAQSIPPVLFYTDIDSGPATGGEGGTDGAFLCVYGQNFGATRGSSTITVGGTEAAQYKLWADPGQPYQAAANMAKACVQISHLTAAGVQNVQLTTALGSSNTLPFTVRSGNIWWVSTSGNDVSGNGSQANPWLTIAQCKNEMAAGDICVIQNGVSITGMENWEAALWLNSSGTSGYPKAIVAYPGANVTIAATVASGEWGATGELQGINNYAGGTASCGSGGCSYWTIAGFSQVNGSNASVNLEGGSNIRLVDNDILCQGAYCDGTSGGLITATPGLYIYGNRLHDIGCHDDVNYQSSAYPCVWENSGVTISTTGASFTLSGAANGLSEGDVIEANGQLRRIISCAANCLAGLASGTLDAAFSSNLPIETTFQYRDFVPSKYWQNVYFGNGSNSVQFAWNSVDGSTGKACRGVQFYATMLDSLTGFSLYDLHVHDNWIHDTVCDGINFATIDPSQGTVEAYNNVIYNAGEGNGSIFNEGNSVGVMSDYACIYSPGYVDNGTPGSGSLLVYNNTLYNCGSRALLGNIGSGAGGIIAVSGAAANLYLVASNNVIFSANGAEPYTQNSSNRFCTAATAYCPSASLNNVLYGLGTAAPKFLADSILTNPEFRAAPSDFYLPIANPAAGASTAGLTSLKDFDGIVRNSANPTPGAFEYVPSLPSSSRPLGATTTTITPSANPQNYGSRLVFTIYVSSAGSSTAVPSGPVLVYDGSVLLAPVTLDGSGYASFAVYALTPGTHTIKASYSGNAIFAASNGNLTETINGPIAAVSTKALSFSSPLKITSASQTITLSNIGTSALTIRSVSAGAPYSQSNNCFPAGSPASLAANASCTIQVTYHPTSTAALAQKASLMINLATPGISQLVALTGSLVAPTFTLSAPSLSAGAMSYGYQMVGSYSNFQTVTVTNTSPLANLTITGISISNWGLSTDACTPFPATLGPGGTCTLALAFRPLTPGAKLGQIKANVANPGTSQSITLNGTGISPISTMPLRNLSFGRVTRGTTRTMTLTVINPANDPQLNGLSVSFSGNSDFSQSTTSPGTCGTTLPGATSIQRCTINVVFAPGSGEGQNSTDAGAVTISGLEGPLPQSVTVSLTGIAY